MAHTLKLTIWKVLLKPSYGEGLTPLSTLFERMINDSNHTNPHEAFLDQYFEYFQGEFKKNKKGTQSFAPINGDIKIRKKKKIIHGFLEGGPTGIDSTVKPNSDSENRGRDIGKDDVVALNNYFMMWLPENVNYCYIMLQSYPDINRGISSAFFEHLALFLRDHRYVIAKKEIKVPKPIQDAFRKHSIIIGMDFIKRKTNMLLRRDFNPGLQDAENLRYKFSLSGLKFTYKKFMKEIKYDNKDNPFFIDMGALGMSDPNEYETIVRYKDPISKRLARAHLSDLVNLKPSIIIPNTVKRNNTEYPDMDKIYDFCKKQLTLLLIEDNYATIDEYPDN